MERQLRLHDLTVDPEFENLIRKQTPDEEKEFIHQMINHGGAYDPIMVWDNDGKYIILDGHHRYWFLLKHPELKYRIEVAHEVHDRDEAGMWIFRQQKGKKNLQLFELAELALRFEPMIKAEAQKRMLSGKKADPPLNSAQGRRGRFDTRDEIAKIAGVGHDTIDKTKKILAEGTEEQINAVRSGEKSINKVYNEIRPQKLKLPKREEVDTQSNNKRSEAGEKIVAGRNLSKRIDEIDKMMSDTSRVSNYTAKDAAEEFEVIMDEFMNKLRRVIQVRNNVIKGNERIKDLIVEFSEQLKELRSEI